MNIPWEIIIPAVIDLISKCLEQNTSEADILGRLQNPRPLDWLSLWLELRQRGLKGGDAREAIAVLRKTTWGTEQLQQLINEAQAA